MAPISIYRCDGDALWPVPGGLPAPCVRSMWPCLKGGQGSGLSPEATIYAFSERQSASDFLSAKDLARSLYAVKLQYQFNSKV